MPPKPSHINDLDNTRSWFEHWPDSLIAFDDSGKIRLFSKRAEKTLGYRQHQVLQRNIHELLCVDTREYAHDAELCPLLQITDQNEQIQSTYWLHQSGSNLSVDYHFIVLQDLTENIRLLCFKENLQEQHNQAERDKLLAYVEQNPLPMAEFDPMGQLLFGNNALHDALLSAGFDEDGQSLVLPKNLASLCKQQLNPRHSVDTNDNADSDASLLQTVENVQIYANERWLAWYFTPLNIACSHSVLGYAFDITNQKYLEHQAEQAQVAARREFYAKMVHELRTPLNAIIGFSQVLIRRLKPPQVEARDLSNLQAIKTAGLQLSAMINNTLDVAKIEAGKAELALSEFTLQDVFEVVADQLNALAQAKGLQFQMQFEPSQALFSDLDKIRQIAVNLCANAIKYTHAGRVDVSARVDGSQNYLHLKVSDTGIGIQNEHLQGLFDKYSRVQDQHVQHIQGSGLGLALVGDWVAMLQGSIEVTSTPGMGSQFFVELPLRHRNS